MNFHANIGICHYKDQLSKFWKKSDLHFFQLMHATAKYYMTSRHDVNFQQKRRKCPVILVPV